MESAMTLFLEKGYGRTTIEDIARAAGVTRGALYWHFNEGKPELFNTLIKEGILRVGRTLEEIFEQRGSPSEKLKAVMTSWLRYLETDEAYRKAMQLAIFNNERNPDFSNGLKEKSEGNMLAIQFIVKIIKEGKSNGEIRADLDPELFGLSAYCFLWGVSELWLFNPELFSLVEISESMVETFLNGIYPK